MTESEEIKVRILKRESQWIKLALTVFREKGGRFVQRIEGSYHAVVGLPLVETEALIAQFFVSSE